MKAKKGMAIILSMVLAAGILPGYGSDNGTANADTLATGESGAETTAAETSDTETGKDAGESGYAAGEWRTYDEPITITFGDAYDVNGDERFTNMAAIGEPYDDNRWTRYFAEDVGVNCEYSLLSATSTDYKTELTLAMASGELPDIFYVPDMSTYQQLVDAGVVADLTDLYESEANDTLKRILTEEGNDFMGNYYIDGSLYTVPIKMPSTNGYNYIYIRQDWLDKLGLEVPTTLDEVKAVAEAFVTQDPDGNGEDDTIGLCLDTYYANFSARGIFWAYGAAASNDYWMPMDDGSVGYGMVQEQAKDGLKWLNEMYNEGLINQDFATLALGDQSKLIASNTCGMFYACHWYAMYINAVKDQVPDAEWTVILAPGTDGNPATVYANVDTNGMYCVNAQCEHPEALFALLNAYAEKLFGENNDFENYFACEETSNLWQDSPVFLLQADVDLLPHRQMKEALANGTLDELTGVGAAYWKYISDGSLTYQLEFGPEGSCFNLVDETYPDIIVWNAYQGINTNTQSLRWSGMQEIIDKAYLEMITGNYDDIDAAFDQMVNDWMNAGGTDVTQEVNDIISAR